MIICRRSRCCWHSKLCWYRFGVGCYTGTTWEQCRRRWCWIGYGGVEPMLVTIIANLWNYNQLILLRCGGFDNMAAVDAAEMHCYVVTSKDCWLLSWQLNHVGSQELASLESRQIQFIMRITSLPVVNITSLWLVVALPLTVRVLFNRIRLMIMMIVIIIVWVVVCLG